MDRERISWSQVERLTGERFDAILGILREPVSGTRARPLRGDDERVDQLSLGVAATVNVVLTGASGFTGGRVLAALLERGHQVAALVRPRSLTPALVGSGARVVPGDLLDTSAVADLVEGADTVVHVAAARSTAPATRACSRSSAGVLEREGAPPAGLGARGGPRGGRAAHRRLVSRRGMVVSPRQLPLEGMVPEVRARG